MFFNVFSPSFSSSFIYPNSFIQILSLTVWQDSFIHPNSFIQIHSLTVRQDEEPKEPARTSPVPTVPREWHIVEFVDANSGYRANYFAQLISKDDNGLTINSNYKSTSCKGLTSSAKRYFKKYPYFEDILPAQLIEHIDAPKSSWKVAESSLAESTKPRRLFTFRGLSPEKTALLLDVQFFQRERSSFPDGHWNSNVWDRPWPLIQLRREGPTRPLWEQDKTSRSQ